MTTLCHVNDAVSVLVFSVLKSLIVNIFLQEEDDDYEPEERKKKKGKKRKARSEDKKGKKKKKKKKSDSGDVSTFNTQHEYAEE